MALFRSFGSEHILTLPFLTTVTIELTQSVGSVTLVIWPSRSISANLLIIFDLSGCGCLLGPCTTGVTVGSIFSEYISCWN